MKKIFLSLFAFVLLQSAAHAQNGIKGNATIAQRVPDARVLASKPCAFRIHTPNQTVFFLAQKNNIDMPVKEFDLGGNVTGNNFKAFEEGVYHFDGTLTVNYNPEDNKNINRFRLYMLRNGSMIGLCAVMNVKGEISEEHTISVSTTVMLQKGDVISLSYEVDSDNGKAVMTRSTDGSFSGFKVNTEQ